MTHTRAHLLDRVFAQCEEVPGPLDTDCIVYTARDGSGLVWDFGSSRNLPAAKVVWEALHGPVRTRRLTALCGRSGCVRPGHRKLA